MISRALFRQHERWLWLAFLLGGLLAAIPSYLLISSDATSDLVYTFAGMVTVVAMLFGIWLYQPVNRLPWWLLVLGTALQALGDLTWAIYELVLGVISPFPSVGDIFYLTGYLVLFIGILLLLRTQTELMNNAIRIDITIISLAVGVVVWIFLIDPKINHTTEPLLNRLLASAYPVVDLLILASAVRLLLGVNRRTTPLNLLLLALLVSFVVDIAYLALPAAGNTLIDRVVDLGWILGYLLYGTLALHPAMVERTARAVPDVDLRPPRIALLTMAALVGPALLLIQALRGIAIDNRTIAVVTAILLLLALLRLQVQAAAARQREIRFRAMVQNSSDIVVVVNPDWSISEVSLALERVLGYQLDAAVKTNLASVVHANDLKIGLRALRTLQDQGQVTEPFVVRVRNQAGGWQYFEVVGTNLLHDSAIQGYVLNCRDITLRRQAEMALRESESSLADAQELAQLGNWTWDRERGVMRWSDQLYHLLGYQPGEIVPHYRYLFQSVPPADRARVQEWARNVHQGGDLRLEHRLILPDGTMRVIQHQARAFQPTEPTQRIRHFAGTLLDITERARAMSLQTLLVEAGEALAAPRDLQGVIQAVAGLVVPAMGDWCILDLYRGHGMLKRVLIAHHDPAQAERVALLTGQVLPIDWPQPKAPATISWRDLAGDSAETTLLQAVTPNAAQSADYRLLGVGALMVAPIQVRDRTLGALTVVCADPLHRYDAQDLALLSDLVRRIGLALDNVALRMALAARERDLQDLVGQLLLKQEEERRRVAYDVHDGLAQLSASIYQRLQAYEYHYRPRPDGEQHELDELLMVAQQTVQEARRVIADLRPTALDDLGLVMAIQRLVESTRTQGYTVTFHHNLDNARFNPIVETALYRVIQEAMNNIRKHAKSTTIWIDLDYDERSIALQVRDNGVGFAVTQLQHPAAAGEQIGLRGMRERITLLGGRFRINSQPGTGTQLSAIVPYPPKAPELGTKDATDERDYELLA